MRLTPQRPWAAAVICFLTLVGVAPAQRFPSADGRGRDLDFVANQLPALHPDFFTKVSREDYQAAVSALQAKVSTATDAEFYIGLNQLIAMAGDGHTSLNLNAAPFRLLPLRLRWFGDGIFVIGASAPYSEALGSRLVRIGDTSIDRAIEQLATVISHENEYWLRYCLPASLINQTVLQGLGLAPGGATTPLTFQTLAGREVTLQVSPSSAALIPALPESDGPLPLYQQYSSLNYWYTYLPEDRVLYFRYTSCKEMASRPFASFAADLLAALDANPVDTFVFDIRSNGGGNSALVAPIFNGLAARFSRLTENPRFRIYDVFDEGTYSSGLMNAEDLLISYPHSIPGPNTSVNLSTRVVSMGQPTGGKPGHFGYTTMFTLPGSSITGVRSTTFWPAPTGIPDMLSLFPSIPVTSRATDYFARFDPVLAQILVRGAGAPPAPAGDVITVNAASFRVDQGIAPGSYVAAFGAFPVAPTAVSISTGGATVTPVFSSQSQVNFIVPPSAPPGGARVTMLPGGQSGTFTISRTGPGIFVTDPANPSQPGAILNEDWTLNTSANPARPGSIVQVFGTGYGGQPAAAYLAETPAEILYNGPQGQYPGLWQINARVPPSVAGQAPLFVLSDGQASNGVTLWVR